jgi:hypothetical protein
MLCLQTPDSRSLQNGGIHRRTVAILLLSPCALSQHQQTGDPLRITQLTSFLTGQALSPDSAYVVRASDVNMCQRTTELMDNDKRAADLRYDRCAPSLIAFAARNDAVQFAREHGGQVMPFRQAAVAFAK